jgi:hypothetical protein
VPGTGPRTWRSCPTGRGDRARRRTAVPAVPDGRRIEVVADTGGRPLGIEVRDDGRLMVCDAHRGLLLVDIGSGEVEVLVDLRATAPIAARQQRGDPPGRFGAVLRVEPAVRARALQGRPARALGDRPAAAVARRRGGGARRRAGVRERRGDHPRRGRGARRGDRRLPDQRLWLAANGPGSARCWCEPPTTCRVPASTVPASASSASDRARPRRCARARSAGRSRAP